MRILSIVLFLVFIMEIVGCAGYSNKPHTANECNNNFNQILTNYIENESVREAFLAVLAGESYFINENRFSPWSYERRGDVTQITKHNLQTYRSIINWGGGIVEYSINRFAVANLGDDGIPVLIFGFSSWRYLILYYNNGKIYGYESGSPLHSLRQNNVFYGIGRRFHPDKEYPHNISHAYFFHKINFSQSVFFVEIAHYFTDMSDDPDNVYFIGDERVTTEEFELFFEELINSTPLVVWYDFNLN